MGSFYIITLLILFIISLSEFIINKSDKLLIYLLPVGLLILIGGLRYGISSDYFHYKEMFYHINEKAKWSSFFVEYGFLWLNLIFSKKDCNEVRVKI